MPTYEYACRQCGQHIDVVQSFSDSALTTCGACGGALRKVFGAAGIIFKGSGYYVNDSRKSAASSAKGNSTDGEAGPGTAEGERPAKEAVAAKQDGGSESSKEPAKTEPAKEAAPKSSPSPSPKAPRTEAAPA